MVHIVHVVHSLEVGGTEMGVVNLISALRDDFRHTVVAMTGAGPLAARLPLEVALYQLGKQPGKDVKTFTRLIMLLRKLAPEVVHTRSWAAMDAVVAARLSRVPVVVHGEHGREAMDPHGLNRRRNRVRRLLTPFIDRFVTVSCDLGRWLDMTVGVPPRKILTIHNGVDTCRFSGDHREAGRRALKLAPETVAVGTVGRLDPVKGQHGLLEGFAGVDAELAPTALVVVGDGPCRSALAGRARQRDLLGRVHLLGERADIPILLGGLDVYVLPSIAEGISNTILEAMATGLPVIATRTGGNPELVEDGATGMLVPVGDSAMLTAALTTYLRRPDLRAAHGTAGRQRAVESFALERMTRRYRDLYCELIREKVAA